MLLHNGWLAVQATHLSENGSNDETFLGLPHIFAGVRHFEAMLNQTCRVPRLNLSADLCDQPRRSEFQHHRLQRKAAWCLPTFNQRTAVQRLNSFQQTGTRHWCDEERQQVIEARRFSQDRQPQQHRLLQSGKPAELLSEERMNTPKNDLTLIEEGSDFASKEINNRLRYNVQGQGIASIGIDQLRSV